MTTKPWIFLAILVLLTTVSFAQNKYEREYRIKKLQFPAKALEYIEENLEDARRIRFYRETDSGTVSYKAKFKKDRLKYSMEFSEEGHLKIIGILIKPVDIPNEAFAKMNAYLKNGFIKYRIRKIHQHYPVGDENEEVSVKNAFQNLMLPGINYELIVAGKKDRGFEEFEVLFDAEGSFEKIRKSLPPNYDHVIY